LIGKTAFRFALLAGLVATVALQPATGSAAQTIILSAGAESTGGDVQLNAFAPNSVAISVGDTITWSLDSTEFHNVMFTSGAPVPEFVDAGPDGVFIDPVSAIPSGGPSYDGTGLVSSGLLVKGQRFSLTFSKAGTFGYVCSIHPGMSGTVRVLEVGQNIDNQGLVDARKAAQVNAGLASGIPAIMANNGLQPSNSATAAIAAGVQSGPVDVLRFMPERVIVGEGDSLSFVWRTQGTPHTVTFLGGQPTPDVIMPQPQANGPPKLQINPAVLAPAGNPQNWNGASLLHSGFRQPLPGQPNPEFTVHFQNPGTYDYVCLLHEGMVGTVIVERR
jgi:plastocyanin